MTDLYIVGAVPGNSHSFVSSSLLHLLTDQTEDIRLSASGNSHEYIRSYLRSNTNYKGWLATHDYHQLHNIEFTDPECTLPLILTEPIEVIDKPVDYDKVFEKYPTFKRVIINMDHEDVPRIAANHFYKMHKEIDHKSHYWADYIEESKTNPNLRAGLSSIRELTISEVDILINRPKTGEAFLRHHMINLMYTDDPAPDKWKDRIYYIKFNDILYNRDAFFAALTAITGKEISPSYLSSHTEYVRLNHALAARYMPWIPTVK